MASQSESATTATTIKILFVCNEPSTPLLKQYHNLDGMIKFAFQRLRTSEKFGHLFPASLQQVTGIEIEQVHPLVHLNDKEAAYKMFPPVSSLFVHGEGEEGNFSTSTRKYDCIILSGSVYFVSDHEPFALAEADWIREVIRIGKYPVLGICFGHQLLGQEIFGAKSEELDVPQGERGSVDVVFSEQAKTDPVVGALAAFSPKLTLNVTHSQGVRKLPKPENPNHLVVLGSSQLEPVHIIRYNDLTYGFQGHSEYRVSFLKEDMIATLGEAATKDDIFQNDDDDFSPALLVHWLAFAKSVQ